MCALGAARTDPVLHSSLAQLSVMAGLSFRRFYFRSSRCHPLTPSRVLALRPCADRCGRFGWPAALASSGRRLLDVGRRYQIERLCYAGVDVEFWAYS